METNHDLRDKKILFEESKALIDLHGDCEKPCYDNFDIPDIIENEIEKEIYDYLKKNDVETFDSKERKYNYFDDRKQNLFLKKNINFSLNNNNFLKKRFLKHSNSLDHKNNNSDDIDNDDEKSLQKKKKSLFQSKNVE